LRFSGLPSGCYPVLAVLAWPVTIPAAVFGLVFAFVLGREPLSKWMLLVAGFVAFSAALGVGWFIHEQINN
jgi:hypothetical protein